MKNILILALATLAISSNSCKKDKTCNTVECDIEGTYKVEVKVTERLPFLYYSETSPDFMHLNKGGFIFYDTNQNVCCQTYNYYDPKFGDMIKEYPFKCPLPSSYTLSGVSISKSDNSFFLKSYIAANNQRYSNLPLSISSNSISYNIPSDIANNFDTALCGLFSHIGVTSDISWINTTTIKWLEFNLNKISIGVYKGNWIFVHASAGSCEFHLSNGNKSKYRIAEFAEVTFTKVE